MTINKKGLFTILLILIVVGAIFPLKSSCSSSNDNLDGKQEVVYHLSMAESYGLMMDSVLVEIDECYKIIKAGKCVFKDRNDSIHLMANIHLIEGQAYENRDFPLAVSLLNESVAEYEAINMQSWRPLHALGLIYFDKDPFTARNYFELAKQQIEKEKDNYPYDYIRIKVDLAISYRDIGMSSKAMTILEEESKNIISNYGNDNTLYGSVEQNKALIYKEITDYTNAIKCINNALECYKKIYGEKSLEYARCLDNLGTIYSDKGDYYKSEEALQKSIKICESLGEPSIHSYLALFTVYAHKNDINKMDDLLEKIKEIGSSNYVDNYSVEADFLISYGLGMYLNGMVGSSEFFKEALNRINEIGEKNSFRFYNTLLSFCLSSFVDQTQSEEIIPELIESYKKQYIDNVVFLNGEERELYFSQYSFLSNV